MFVTKQLQNLLHLTQVRSSVLKLRVNESFIPLPGNRYEAVLTDPGQGGSSNVWRYLVIERRGEPLLHFHKIRILEVLSDLGVRLGVCDRQRAG